MLPADRAGFSPSADENESIICLGKRWKKKKQQKTPQQHKIRKCCLCFTVRSFWRIWKVINGSVQPSKCNQLLHLSFNQGTSRSLTYLHKGWTPNISSLRIKGEDVMYTQREAFQILLQKAWAWVWAGIHSCRDEPSLEMTARRSMPICGSSKDISNLSLITSLNSAEHYHGAHRVTFRFIDCVQGRVIHFEWLVSTFIYSLLQPSGLTFVLVFLHSRAPCPALAVSDSCL